MALHAGGSSIRCLDWRQRSRWASSGGRGRDHRISGRGRIVVNAGDFRRDEIDDFRHAFDTDDRRSFSLATIQQAAPTGRCLRRPHDHGKLITVAAQQGSETAASTELTEPFNPRFAGPCVSSRSRLGRPLRSKCPVRHPRRCAVSSGVSKGPGRGLVPCVAMVRRCRWGRLAARF